MDIHPWTPLTVYFALVDVPYIDLELEFYLLPLLTSSLPQLGLSNYDYIIFFAVLYCNHIQKGTPRTVLYSSSNVLYCNWYVLIINHNINILRMDLNIIEVIQPFAETILQPFLGNQSLMRTQLIARTASPRVCACCWKRVAQLRC